MKDLKVDINGDLVIDNDDLMYVSGEELIRQKIKLILSTNKTEWLFDKNQGIDFFAMLTKNPDRERIYNTIINGLTQADENMIIENFDITTKQRRMNIRFTARNGNGNTETYTVTMEENGIRTLDIGEAI